jgi:hypothetical protein
MTITGKSHERIDGRLRSSIEAQPVFFTATAPLAADGHVNLSPKGRSGTLACRCRSRRGRNAPAAP